MSASKEDRWNKLAMKSAINEQTKSEKDEILNSIASDTQSSTQSNTHRNTQDSKKSDAQDAAQISTQDNKVSNTQNNTQTSTQGNIQFTEFVQQIDAYKHKTMDQTHTRKNYLIKNEIVFQLDKEAQKHPRGWPTKLINGLLEGYLNELKRIRDK